MNSGRTTESERELTQCLIDTGLWIETGVRGVYGRDSRFESIVDGIDRIIIDWAEKDGAEKIYFPPVMNRDILVRSDYFSSFPELCGCVHSFTGDESAHAALMQDVSAGKSWHAHLEDSDLVLTPAACYPLYPTLRGTLPIGGRLLDLSSFVLRREPSDDPARLQVFRQRENVRVGSQHEVETWRSRWLDRGLGILESLQLPASLHIATDPFFGRAGRMLKTNQRNDRRKFELTMPIHPESPPTALASFNYHDDKFGTTFEIVTADGSFAHTACFGFGLERVALALLCTHGFDSDAWPSDVRKQFGW